MNCLFYKKMVTPKGLGNWMDVMKTGIISMESLSFDFKTIICASPLK